MAQRIDIPAKLPTVAEAIRAFCTKTWKPLDHHGQRPGEVGEDGK